ncbi:ABC transporter ATP-binding protein [Tumebacillus lipolyticus]|uniref:ABC transporter ATP-binding protein n=1 Tax=Tumebacillus lipolyticus TaxID=1280370 RepID=A0ABW5A0V1_9BACL
MKRMMIEVENLTKTYTSGQRTISVLNNISLAIEEGQMVALLGPSGSGKTTLLHLLGLVDVPTSGTIRLNSHDLSSTSRDNLRRNLVGYVFQHFYLLPQFSALYNVCVPQIPVKSASQLETTAKELLDRVGLEDRIHHLPSELSGGEQQRVAIARALIHAPKILLCDEPTGNLDIQTRDSILELICELKNEEGLTIVIATHDPEVAAQCDVQVEIRNGKLSSYSPLSQQ